MHPTKKKSFNSIVTGIAILTVTFGLGSKIFSEETGKTEETISAPVIKGDFRTRYHTQKMESESDARQRARFRVRVNTDFPISKSLQFTFGTASGGADARSGNQTFENTFKKYDLKIERAFVTYKPRSQFLEGASIRIGKMTHPLWIPSEFLWDADINPDGIALEWNSKIDDTLNIFSNGAFFVMDDLVKNSKSGPYLLALQPGMTYKVNEETRLKSALIYYHFNHLKGAELTNGSSKSGNGNTMSGGVLANDFRVAAISNQISFKNIFSLPAVTILTEYARNISASSDGILAGITFGDAKLKKRGEWQVTVHYKELGSDVWPDVIPDADFYRGATGVKGWEWIVSYALSQNTVFTLDYYKAESKTLFNPEYVLQADLNVKF